ncbi:hypothetical protein [Nostoc sp. FACHB-133]|uniref:hypothetical protein n=1 Tax=Nostoc sp. FACHB-133 TaxID=2692835 RepID=UPI001688449A|nr:hypothetical protein [Nostoc sp. FACHB-133]MBD2527699.1 hypothetical protein [Nostoc sp. FACHB-133]
MDEVSSKLLEIFKNINEWLKFAEAKNGILLAFSGAALTYCQCFLNGSTNRWQEQFCFGCFLIFDLT